MASRRIEGSQQRRSLPGELRLVSEEERRIELSFSSESPYERYFGPEILCHDDGCVDLERLRETGALLFHHGRDANLSFMPIGRIVEVSQDGSARKCRAVVEFDTDEKSELVYQKVRSGTIRGVSVGYRIGAYEEVKAGSTSSNGRFRGPCIVATRWTPYEISIEPTPADDTVGIGRSTEEDITEMENEITAEVEIPDQSERSAATPPLPVPTAARAADADAAVQRAVEQERARVDEITSMCRSFDIDPTEYVRTGSSVDAARVAVLEALRVQRTGQPPLHAPNVEVKADEEDRFRAAARDGLLLRMGFSVAKPADGAQDFQGVSLRSLAGNCLQRVGASAQLWTDDERLLKAALGYDERSGALTPNAAFVSVLNDTMGAVVSTGYNEIPTTFQQWTSRGSNPNFKATKRFRLSAAGEIVEVAQSGEFKKDEISDEGISTQLKTFGKKFGFTRQTFVDDDLGTVAKAVQAQVRSCKRTINRKVYAILGENQKYIDGKALFSADHGNLGTAGAMSVGTLGDLYILLTTQKDLSGKATLNLAPEYILCPAALSMEAYRLIRSQADPSGNNSGVVNPIYDRFKVIVDAELDRYSKTAYYVVANSRDVDTIEVTYLNGKDTPTMENRVSWNTLGIEYRLYHDFNVTLLDYRGLAANMGK